MLSTEASQLSRRSAHRVHAVLSSAARSRQRREGPRVARKAVAESKEQSRKQSRRAAWTTAAGQPARAGGRTHHQLRRRSIHCARCACGERRGALVRPETGARGTGASCATVCALRQACVRRGM